VLIEIGHDSRNGLEAAIIVQRRGFPPNYAAADTGHSRTSQNSPRTRTT
jgi:hypothetical protein